MLVFWYRLGQSILPRLPRRLVYWLCDGLALIVFLVQPTLRRTLFEHGRIIRPDWGTWQRPLMGWRTLAYVFRNYIDLLCLPTTSFQQLLQRYEYSGIEYLDMLRPQGGMMVVPHLGSWSTTLALLAGYGHQIVLVVEPIEPPELLELISDLRQAHGIEVAPLGPNVGRVILRALKQGKIVVLAGDRALADQTVTLPFFGQPTQVPAGPGRLAARKVPVLAGFSTWQPSGRYIGRLDWLGVWELDEQETNEELALRATAAMLAYLEWAIRSFPTSWGVLQPVWNTTTQGSLS